MNIKLKPRGKDLLDSTRILRDAKAHGYELAHVRHSWSDATTMNRWYIDFKGNHPTDRQGQRFFQSEEDALTALFSLVESEKLERNSA